MVKLKTIILIIGDIFFLYLSLALTLSIRYGLVNLGESLGTHLKPFSLIFVIWILIFYLTDLYEIRSLKDGFQLAKSLGTATIFGVIISIILFYLFENFFELTPKTNLALFSVIFTILDFAWRLLITKSDYARTRLLVIGDSKTTREIISYIENNPQIGYDLVYWLKDDLRGSDSIHLGKLVRDKKIDFIVIPSRFMRGDLPIVKFIYQLLPFKVKVLSSADFYEMIFQKIPLEELEEAWFIEKITTRRKAYNLIKRVIDIFLSLVLGIVFLPIIILVALLTKMSSRRGPAIFKQERAGINDENFILFKFGTMRSDKGALWTTEEDDRVTSLGKFLRYTHLDETPQLWNILKGDISFIGPRAERVELVEKYKNLPYYEIRHVIKPGLTGWAQVNYRASASLEEAFEKLKYDIYYIKNRSLVLDFLIIVKTIRFLFSKPN